MPKDGVSPARLIDGARNDPLKDSGALPGYEEITVSVTVEN